MQGVKSVSGEKLHDFEIICSAKRVHLHPRTPFAYGPVMSTHNVFIEKYGKLSPNYHQIPTFFVSLTVTGDGNPVVGGNQAPAGVPLVGVTPR